MYKQLSDFNKPITWKDTSLSLGMLLAIIQSVSIVKNAPILSFFIYGLTALLFIGAMLHNNITHERSHNEYLKTLSLSQMNDLQISKTLNTHERMLVERFLQKHFTEINEKKERLYMSKSFSTLFNHQFNIIIIQSLFVLTVFALIGFGILSSNFTVGLLFLTLLTTFILATVPRYFMQTKQAKVKYTHYLQTLHIKDMIKLKRTANLAPDEEIILSKTLKHLRHKNSLT